MHELRFSVFVKRMRPPFAPDATLLVAHEGIALQDTYRLVAHKSPCYSHYTGAFWLRPNASSMIARSRATVSGAGGEKSASS